MAIIYQAEDTIEPWSDTDAEMLGNSSRYNVRDGCAVTYSGANMQATIASGNVTHNGSVVAVAGGTVTLVADGSNPRWTWIYVDSTGTPGMSAGTAASDPSKPELGDNVALALVKVEAGQTIANNITYKLDKRIANPGGTDGSFVRKAADESVTSSSTLQNDNELVLAVAANTTYVFEASLAYTAGTTGDFKASVTFLSGATCFASIQRLSGSTYAEAAGGQIISGGPSLAGEGLGTTIPALMFWRGVLMVGATAGNLQVQWAQNVSNGTATTVKAGSVLRFPVNELTIWTQDGQAQKFAIAADNLLPAGKRAIVRNERATNASDPGRIRVVQWEYATPIGYSRESVGGVLGCDYAQNLDTRFPRRLISAGTRTAVTLTSKDPSGVSSQQKLAGFKLGAQKLGSNVSTSDNVTHFDEQGGRLFAHRGQLSTQVLISSWTVEATAVHPESVQGATSWYGKGRVGLGASALMRTRAEISTTGSVYESTQTIIGEDVYAGAIAVGSDRCWYVTKGSTGELENLVGYTLDDFDTIANPFQVGDPRVKANGIGPFGPFTFFGTRTNIYSFTDQAKKVPLSRALIGHNSANNGKQWAVPGWGWNYYISDTGLRAATSHIDNPVGIGQAMKQFTGHNGRPTAIYQEGGELFVVYQDSSGNSWGYRCIFGPQTSQSGQPEMYPWWYKASTTCEAIFSTNTPTNTALVWGEGTSMAYETISRDGRDDTFTSRTYSTAGGSWFGTTLDRDPHLLKVLRLARMRTKGITSGSSWELLWSFDDDTYLSVGTVTDNGYQIIRPVQENVEVPLDDIAGRTMKPKLVQVASGSGASSTPPELNGVLEVEYDERPDYITEVACTIQLEGTGISKSGVMSRLNSLKGTTTSGPVRMQLPDTQGEVYGLVANVQNRRDLKGDGVEAVDVILHLWSTS